MVNLTAVKKGIRWPLYNSPAQVYNSLRWCLLLKLSADQLLVLIDRMLSSIMKKPHSKELINLPLSVNTGKSQTWALMYWPRYHLVNTQHIKASVWDFPVMTEWTRLTNTVDIVHEWGQDGWILAKFLKMQRTIINYLLLQGLKLVMTMMIKMEKASSNIELSTSKSMRT